MTDTAETMTMVERVAREVGAIYDGYADPIDTPTNWARAMSAARAAIAAIAELTPAMIEAGHALCGDPCWPEDYAKAFKASCQAALAEQPE